MQFLLMALSAIILSGCGNEKRQTSVSEKAAFGEPFFGSWEGGGRLIGTKCESVKVALKPVAGSRSSIQVTQAEVECGEKGKFSLPDQIVLVDGNLTYQSKVESGFAGDDGIDLDGRWFSFRVEIPEVGAGELYMSFQIFLFDKKAGPTLFVSVDRDADKYSAGFFASLTPKK